MADSEAAEASSGVSQKRKRVSRACDQCYSKKDKCDGTQPVCHICKKVGRPCTYKRPERKRGPLQGVRQRLEEQIEALESILGFLVDAFPGLTREVVQKLTFDEKAATSSQAAGRQARAASDTEVVDLSSPKEDRGCIFPEHTRAQARDAWRQSDLAICVAPFLGLRIPASGEGSSLVKEEEVGEAEFQDELRRSSAAREYILQHSTNYEIATQHQAAALSHRPSQTLGAARQYEHWTSNQTSHPAASASSVSETRQSPAQAMHWSYDLSGPRNALSVSLRTHAFPFSEARSNGEAPQNVPSSWSAQASPVLRDVEASGRPSATTSGLVSTAAAQDFSRHLPGIPSHLDASSPGRAQASSARSMSQRSDGSRFASQRTPSATGDLVNALALPSELEEEMDHLLDAYFTHFHPLYPFVDKDSLLRWSSATDSQGAKRLLSGSSGVQAMLDGPGSSPSSGRTAIVLAICAVACSGYGSATSGWSSYSRVGGSPDTSGTSANRNRLQTLGEDCHSRARSLFFATPRDSVFAGDELHSTRRSRADPPHELEAVQASLLLIIADMLKGHYSCAWAGLGVATKLAQDLHLERATPPTSIGADGSSSSGSTPGQRPDVSAKTTAGRHAPQRSAHSERQRRLTFHSLFCIETFLAAALGRPPALRAVDSTVSHPDIDRDQDEWALVQARAPPRAPGGQSRTKTVKSRAISTLVAQTELAVIVNDMLLGVLLPEHAQGETIEILAAAAKSAVEAKINTWAARLHRWRTSLPTHLATMVQATPGATSLAGPDPPVQPQPCHMWHLSMLCHFSFTLVERAALAAAQQDWSALLSRGHSGWNEGGRWTLNGSPSGHKFLIKHVPVSGLTNLWRLPAAPSPSLAGEGMGRRPSGRGDWKRVTIQSPTSTGALPRLLSRFCECFGDSRLPPLAPFFALSAAHLSGPPLGKGSEEWDALEKVVNSGAAVWNASFVEVAAMLPVLQGNTDESLAHPPLPRLDESTRQVADDHSAEAGAGEGSTFSTEVSRTEQMPFDSIASMSEVLDGAHALAYALGLTEAGDAATHTELTDPSYLGQFGGVGLTGAPAHGSSHHGQTTPFKGTVDLGRMSVHTPHSETESFTELFDTAAANADQSALLYHLGLQAPEELRRPSMSGTDLSAGVMPLHFEASAEFQSHPIEGLPLTTSQSRSLQIPAPLAAPVQQQQQHPSTPSPFAMQHHHAGIPVTLPPIDTTALPTNSHEGIAAIAQGMTSNSALDGPDQLEFGDLIDKWIMRGSSSKR